MVVAVLLVLMVALLVSELSFPTEVELEGVTELVMTSRRVELEPQVQAEVEGTVEQALMVVVYEVMPAIEIKVVNEVMVCLLLEEEVVELELTDALL